MNLAHRLRTASSWRWPAGDIGGGSDPSPRRIEMTDVTHISGGRSVRLPYTFTIPTHEYRSLPIPSLDGAKIGDCFVEVTALPDRLDAFMEVNPRAPNRTKKGVLSGPVGKGFT